MFYETEVDVKNLEDDIDSLLDDVSVNAGKPKLVLVSCDQCLQTLLSKVRHNVYLINHGSYDGKSVAEPVTVFSSQCYHFEKWYHSTAGIFREPLISTSRRQKKKRYVMH